MIKLYNAYWEALNKEKVEAMLTTIKKIQSGFTIIELLIVIAVIAVLGLLTVNINIGAQAKNRDTNRVVDIGNIKNELEKYYNENNGYPNTFQASTFVGIDAESLKDPKGNSITINAVVADEAAANAVEAPTADSPSQYLYIPYGDPSCTNNCSGFVLKAYIEKPTTIYSNPYTTAGAGNK